jgi:hypothetical protein
MLHARSLPPKLWVEGLKYVNHIQKKSLHRYVKNHTPFEAWSSNKPEVTHFQIFGSCAWAHIPFEKRKALDLQSIACIFVGYPNGMKGYKFLDPSTCRIIIECSVQFEETPLHASSEPHVDTSIPLPAPIIIDYESTHSNHGLDLNSKSDLKYDEHADVEIPQMPKWAKTTL